MMLGRLKIGGGEYLGRKCLKRTRLFIKSAGPVHNNVVADKLEQREGKHFVLKNEMRFVRRLYKVVGAHATSWHTFWLLIITCIYGGCGQMEPWSSSSVVRLE